MRMRKLLGALALGLPCLVGAGFALPAHAQLNTGLNEVGQTIKLTAEDPRVLASRIINVVLGVIGIILLTLVLYAGFLWMTAGGDAEKVQKAQKILRNAIIGLIIILAAWAITYYVINVLLNATGGGGGGGGGSGGGGGGGGFGGGGTKAFRVVSASPQGDDKTPYNTNSKVNITFSQEISPDISKDWAKYIQITQNNTPVSGTWEIVNGNGQWIRFTPGDNCVEDPNQKCFSKNTLFAVTINKGTFISASKENLNCSGLYPSCDFKFYIGDKMDTQAPVVTITDVYDYQSFCENVPYVSIPAKAEDDVGVSIMQWLEDSVMWDSDGPSGQPTPKTFTSSKDWSTVGKILKQPYAIEVNATDLDSNVGSRTVHLTVLKDHCCNKKMDSDETGVDCGGKDCLTCGGGACSGNEQCSSGVCQNGVCVNQPIITNVSPTSGRDGTFVSIWGGNFGGSGTTTFMGPPPVEAFAPAACAALNVKTWTDNFILVEVPKGAQTGPIKVYNNESKLSDTTEDNNGPILPSFEVNNVTRPGICKIDPAGGKPGIKATLSGANFGNSQGDRLIGFGATAQITQTAWTDQSIAFTVPNLYAGWFMVGIKNKVGDPLSNAVPFDMQGTPALEAPTIASISPNHGPTGQYVTLVGQHFGSSQGLVKFVDLVGNTEITGDVTFPPDCGSGWWSDTQITIKVPTMVDGQGKQIPAAPAGAPPNFKVFVQRNQDNKQSNKVDFTFTNEALGPGICRITPTAGPKKTVVQIYGERFGSSKGAGDQVTFANEVNADTYNSWESQKIEVVVPDAAVTGKLYVKPAVPPPSNEVQFLVGDCRDVPNVCTAKQICCPGGSCADDKCPATSFQAMYGWEMTTGIIPRRPSVVQNCRLNPQPGDLVPPSPSPWEQWPGGDNVCVNQAKLGVLFNMPVEGTASQLQGKIKLMQCVGKDTDPCQGNQARVPVEITSFTKQTNHLNGNITCALPPDSPDCTDYITFEPKNSLAKSAIYEVYVSSDVKSLGQFGDTMEEVKTCAEPGSGYCYRFKTRADDSACEVGFVYMDPYSVAVPGKTTLPFTALPVAKDAVCNLMTCRGFDWSWSIKFKDLPTLMASFITPLKTYTYNGQTHVDCTQSVQTGDEETPDVPVHVLAQEVLSTKEGIGELYIKRLIPQVIDHSPDCKTACVNAYIWARFNTSLKLSTISNKTVQVYECANENCLPSDLIGKPNLSETFNFKISLWPEEGNNNNLLNGTFGTSTVQSNSFILVDPRDYSDPNKQNPPLVLQSDRYYLVKLVGAVPGSIMSQYGTPMAQDFIWKFKTASGDAAYCVPDRVSVFPNSAIEKRIGDREFFQAKVFSQPDQCRSDGQMLLVTNSFIWSFVDLKQEVAKYAPFPPPKQIDADGTLPPGCDAKCLASGSEGIFGQTAKCGNGVVETTDNKYCDSTTHLTKAGQTCKIMPMISGAGEQCDGNLKNDPLAAKCSPKTCLWENTPPINLGTCGNFTVDYAKGEMCDPGLRCFDTATSTVASGVPCDTPGQNGNVSSADCAQAGGKCEIRSFNGCSSGCKNLGSSAMQGSECGTGLIGYGEDCDQGPNNGVGGCSSECLHKGSSSSIGSLCGNGNLEPGEACESSGPGEPLPAWCDPVKCLKLGNSTFETKFPPDPLDGTCGNGVIDSNKGEECDDGNHINGDGCSSVCLNEGSSWRYPKNGASLCGNGKLEKGETCETANGKGNGLIDPIQIGEIVGRGIIDPVTKIKQTKLNVQYLSVQAEATFGVQCGNTREEDCSQNGNEISVDSGLDADGCCNERPKRVSNFPMAGSTDVCRNTLISVGFNLPMDTASVQSNFIVAKEINDTKCPEGTTLLTDLSPDMKGFWPWLKFNWNKLVAWFGGHPVQAGVWCSRTVAGQVTASTSTKEFYYTLSEALDSNTRYAVRLAGDDNLGNNEAASGHAGIKTKDGVVALMDSIKDPVSPAGDFTWWFQTGGDICRIDGITVEDLDPDHPTYFQKANEVHGFRATAMSLHNGKVEQLAPVKQYQWNWWGWLSNNPPVADMVGSDFTVNGAVTEASVTSKAINGSAIIYAGLQVTSDTIDGAEKLDEPKVTFGALPIMVFLCDNPWPELTKAPFKDIDPKQDANSSLVGTIFENSNLFFNFQTMYCRDAESNLLPELLVHPIPPAPVDQAQGILRQYLFSFQEPAFRHDGIGIRIMSNQYHDTLDEWYTRQGFLGKPSKVKIDGYEALKDQGTVYVGFANTSDKNSNIYQNILVISRNLDAMPETVKVFDQLVDSLAFNINFQKDNINLCTDNIGKPVSYDRDNKKSSAGFDLVKGKTISCVADWDCVTASDHSTHCASYKLKLQRDLIRFGDFAKLKDALRMYYSDKGYYPQLSEGTFLYGRSNSRWPSWSEAFGKALGVDAMPIDPVNRALSCGFCAKKSDNTLIKSMPCTLDSDCPSDEYVCQADGGFDPKTCWDTPSRKFLCPDIFASASYEEVPHSSLYVYRAYQNGRRFELGSDFEVPPPNVADLKNWWMPELDQNISVCYTTSTVSDGRICHSDDDCKPCANPYDPNSCLVSKGPVGSCRVLGNFLYRNICDNNTYVEGGVCGDGVIGDICYGGGKNGQSCKSDNDCPSGQCKPETCELGQTHPEKCAYGNELGTKLQVCNSCMGWVDDPKTTLCHANAVCGNGRIDKTCSAGDLKGLTCSVDTDCTDVVGPHKCGAALVGSPPHPEACDDGVLNGTYGHCNIDCTGIDKFCGNNKLDPGEKCDRGSSAGGNGAWCGNLVDCYFYLNDPSLANVKYDQSCGLDCQSKAPFCGDGQVYPDSSLEECDGSVLTSASALCSAGDFNKINQPCASDADCGVGGKCGGGVNYESCVGHKLGRCNTAAKVCLSVTQADDFSKSTWFAQSKTYALCNVNGDCASNQLCVPLAYAGGDQGGCTGNSQCQAGNVPGECLLYDTAHVRRCGQPGAADQCKYEKLWSVCKPQHSCGDGVVDPGEECDDGSNNADFKACTSLCKKNVCGDGNLYLNVEECDKGSNNGKQTCQAEYESTCNDCSLQCKNLTASGGYCGNGVKEASEQCDGNDVVPPNSSMPYSPGAQTALFFMKPHYILQSDLTDTWEHPDAKVYVGSFDPAKGGATKVLKPDVGNLNCKSLGYDFAIDSLANAALFVNNPAITQDNGPKGLFTNYWGSETNVVWGQIQNGHPPRVMNLVKPVNYADPTKKFQDNALLNTILDVCGLIRKEKANDGIYDFYWIDQTLWPSKQEFWNCVNTFGSKFGFQMVGDSNDKPSCGLDCTIGGCGRCIEEAGNTTIGGKVHIVDTNNDNNAGPIENARVTLQYNGLNVTQVFTDKDGYFEFHNLNNRSECSSYKLIFEKFNYIENLIYGQNLENALTCDCGYVSSATGNFSASNFGVSQTFFIGVDIKQCNNGDTNNLLPNCKIVKSSSLPQ